MSYIKTFAATMIIDSIHYDIHIRQIALKVKVIARDEELALQ